MMKSSPSIVCGAWHEDNWISPYVRGTFAVSAGRRTLRLGIYNPPTAQGTNVLAIRQGWRLLTLTPPVAPDSFVSWSHVFGGDDNPAGEISISLRAQTSYLPGGADARELGVVITEWSLESGVDETG